MIRIGVIGAGPNGTGNAKSLAAISDRCKITAVADPNPEAAKKLAGEYQAKVVSSAKELFDDVDAVVISSPNWLHPEQTIECADAGKHVWIEKPMALSVEDADRMASAIDKAGVASMVGFSVRFDGTVRKMKEVYDSGQIGKLVSIWSRRLCCFPLEKAAPWRLDYAKSGGVMTELIVHEIDWIVDIAGMPKSVYCRRASRAHDNPKMNEHIWLTMAFDEDATGTIEGSQMSRVPDYYRGLVGVDGGIVTTNWGSELSLTSAEGDGKAVDKLENFNKHEHFLDVIDGKCKSVADVHYGRAITLIAEKAIESAVTGQAINL